MSRLPLCCLVLALVAACESGAPDRIDVDAASPSAGSSRQPIEVENAYAAAQLLLLPQVEPEDTEGLENVFTLSDELISGSEPGGEAAFRALAARGVRTIVSVDGKAPDVELARRYDLRYVHIPIQYKDVTETEVLQLSKTFRELPGPFYVHCFHGRHRGPAAAAVGRLALDGASRERALAEMRQYCGTSGQYEGLYAAIATREIPTPEETGSCNFAFPEQVKFGGIRDAMIPLPRARDNLKLLAKNDFEVDPRHPDIDALQEAIKLAQVFQESNALGETKARSADFRKWMAESATESERLAELLRQPLTEETRQAAKATLSNVGRLCSACHREYRK